MLPGKPSRFAKLPTRQPRRTFGGICGLGIGGSTLIIIIKNSNPSPSQLHISPRPPFSLRGSLRGEMDHSGAPLQYDVEAALELLRRQDEAAELRATRPGGGPEEIQRRTNEERALVAARLHAQEERRWETRVAALRERSERRRQQKEREVFFFFLFCGLLSHANP